MSGKRGIPFNTLLITFSVIAFSNELFSAGVAYGENAKFYFFSRLSLAFFWLLAIKLLVSYRIDEIKRKYDRHMYGMIEALVEHMMEDIEKELSTKSKAKKSQPKTKKAQPVSKKK